VQIREATRADRARILAFLKAEDPEDYVISWIGRFLAAGRFVLLLDGRKVAGIVHGRLAPDGSAWLSAARVRPDYRGQGWVNRLNDFALSTPGLRSARAARMLITHENTSSRRAAAKGGFTQATALSFMEWEQPVSRKAPAGARSGFARVSPRDFLESARGSTLLARQNGFAYMSFNGAFTLDERSARAARPWLWLSPASGPVMACMFPDTGERWMAIQAFRSNSTVASGLIDFARARRAESITVILPAAESARRPFARAGYTASEWAKRVLIYDKKVRPNYTRGLTASRGAAARRTRRR